MQLRARCRVSGPFPEVWVTPSNGRSDAFLFVPDRQLREFFLPINNTPCTMSYKTMSEFILLTMKQ